MIDRLTPEQEARMAEYRERWINIGLCTDPAYRPRAEDAIRRMYVSAGLKPPRKIVWCGSPLSQGLTRAVVLDKELMKDVRDSVWASVWGSVGDSVRASVWGSVGDSVRDSVWASVWGSVGDSVWASVRDSVWNSVRNSVRDSVWASVWGSVGDSVRASVWGSVGNSVGNSVWASVWGSVGDSVGDSVRDSVWNSVRSSVWDSVWASVWGSVGSSVGNSVGNSGYGQHDASLLAFYEFFREVCGLREQTDKVVGLLDQARSAGWYLAHQQICWVSERHNILLRDARGRLHNALGPAVAYPDGWAIYVWHGTRVPASVIEQRDSLTVAQIMSEQNTEIRRVMRNLYGTGRFLHDAGAQVISEQRKHKAKLLSMRIDGDPEDIRMVELTCPTTGEVYYERVPPDITDCLAALAWRWDVSPEQYSPIWEA